MLSIKEINSKIAGIKRSTAAVRNNIHEVLCSAAGHAYEHGDVTSFTKLLAATSGVNQKRIMAWVRANGFATWNAEKDCYVINKSARKDADFEDGTACAIHLFANVPAWYESVEKPSDINRELDALARIQSLRKQIAKSGTVVKHVDFQALKTEMEFLLQDIQKYA